MTHSEHSAKQDDERRSKSYDWQIAEERFLLAKIENLIDGRALLDIGCGSSPTVRHSLSLSEHDYSYVGVDIAAQPLRIARLFMNGCFLQCSANDLPFRNGSFEFILFLGALHHLPDQTKGFLEAIRVLKPEGYMALREPLELRDRLDDLVSRARRFLDWITPQSLTDARSPWERPISEKQLLEHIRKHGELVVHQRIYSRPGHLFVTLLGKLCCREIGRNLMFWKVKVVVDEAIEKTLGKRFSTFRGTTLFILMRKCSRKMID
jgi:ubiquinone/menaquinone biosynthesis C-methylase UbiE